MVIPTQHGNPGRQIGLFTTNDDHCAYVERMIQIGSMQVSQNYGLKPNCSHSGFDVSCRIPESQLSIIYNDWHKKGKRNLETLALRTVRSATPQDATLRWLKATGGWEIGRGGARSPRRLGPKLRASRSDQETGARRQKLEIRN